jgi:hypothetical protein
MYVRLKLPETQRTPWPKTDPLAPLLAPCSTTLVAVGRSPLEVNTTVSYVTRAMPVAPSCAPPVFELLLQPRPTPTGGFPHGQALTPPAPGSQNETPGAPQPAGLAQRASRASPESRAFVNQPPAYSAGPSPVSIPARTRMVLSVPPPSADQLLPSQLAMWPAGLPPASVNAPAATRRGPRPSSKAVSASTWKFIPIPSADQLVPFHFAMSAAPAPPAIENNPPA